MKRNRITAIHTLIHTLTHALVVMALIAFMTFVAVVISSCMKTDSTITKDGIRYGFTEGTFRARWWSYYDRGVFYSENGNFQEAIRDFTSATERRSDDEWRARTYGMHRTDYFPHRELGVAHYKLKQYEEAKAELEKSLDTADSAKAKYYLNLVKKAIIEGKMLDTRPPTVKITSPSKKIIYTNALSYRIKGEAEAPDDTYVSSVSVGDMPLLIELSTPKFAIDTDVQLKDGKNTVKVTATDLMGKSASDEVEIIVDREGPVIALDEVSITGKTATIKGAIFDNSGIQSYSLNATEYDGGSLREFPLDIQVETLQDAQTITLLAKDLAGNETRAEIPLRGSAGVAGENAAGNILLLAANGVSDASFGMAGSGVAQNVVFPILWAGLLYIFDTTPPSISLKDLTDTQETYLESIMTEGIATDDSKLKSLTITINGQVGEELLNRQFKTYHFARLVNLRVGINFITVEAEDMGNNKTSKPITVIRKVQKVRQLGSRMIVGMSPLKREGIKGEKSLAVETVDEYLLKSFDGQKRFNTIDRSGLDVILREQKLSASNLVNPATAIRPGRIVATEAIVTGSIIEGTEDIVVSAHIADTETSPVILSEDVYIPYKTVSEVEKQMDVLAFKFKRDMPMVEGMVTRAGDKSIIIDAGDDKHIRKGMRFYLFREGKVTGKVPGKEDEVLGEAKVKDTYKESSTAEVIRKSGKLKVLDKIIMK
ncbi:MAG: hypothetical protein HQK89_05725 [Nitrospirae bacterium]|nr:hypothetical protein [Nitrospirota bacterium]